MTTFLIILYLLGIVTNHFILRCVYQRRIMRLKKALSVATREWMEAQERSRFWESRSAANLSRGRCVARAELN